MKNFTLLLVALLPFFGFSQVDLVKWNGANNSLTSTTSSGVYSQDVAGYGSVTISAMSYDQNQQFFQTSASWPNAQTNGGVVDNSRYVEFVVGATSGNQVTLANFKFQAHMQGNPAKFLIRYSKDASFSSNVYTLLPETSLAGGDQSTWTSFNLSFNSAINPVLSTEKVYVRFYCYNTYDRLEIARQNASNSQFSPTITGSSSAATPACAPPTNTQAFGNDLWNGYVYTYTDNNTNFDTATYVGTVTEAKNFFRDMSTGQVTGATRNIPCVTPPSDRFMVRYKMTTPVLTAGQYNFTVGADDGYRLYIDGTLQTDLSDFTDHGYNQKSKTITLTAGQHNLIYEYYEKTGDATVMFSYGKVDASSFPFGNNVWNVYAFNSDTNATASTYAGSYVDSNLTINTEAFWANGTSPSSTSSYSGAPVPKDYFTTVFKRKGFPCGKFSIRLNKFDDDVVVILNGTQIESRTGTGSNYVLPNNYILKPTDEIEVRLVERGGAALLNMSFVDVPTVYNSTATPTAAQALGTSIRIEKTMTLPSDVTACSCTVVAGNTLTIPSDRTLILQDNLTVEANANFTVENNGSFVQINNNAVNTGSINVKRNTALVRRYDFTYWSSPVMNQTLYNLSPNTLGDKYYSYNPVSGWVIHYNGAETMQAGKGYIVRAPQQYDINNAAIYNATFVGQPNNGIVTQAITPSVSNLIGNPYPSAISADAIYSANSGKITGTFYFWTHNSLPNSSNGGNASYNYTSDDYASYNVIGGVKTKPTAYGGTAPTGNIASGQSFFITGSNAGGSLEFNNAMRVTTSGNNSQFFRTTNETQAVLPVNIEKHRLWLNISNETGDFNETLVGYVSDATNGLDEAFDGTSFASGNARIYSIIDDTNLVIQGRSLPFTDTDIVPLGVTVGTAGQYTINMDQFDGVFANQAIYLYDKSTSTYHDLKSGDFVFNSEAGTFNNRFEIRYKNETLGIDTPVVSQNDLVVYKSGNQISVRANNLTIDSVQVYDITGKLITSGKNINNSTFSTTGLNVATQVLIVKVTLDNNQTVSKKVIMN